MVAVTDRSTLIGAARAGQMKQRDVARELGISPQRASQLVTTVDVRAIRGRLQMTRADFSRKFGLNLATVRDWEDDRYQPTGPARVLLIVIDNAPDAVIAAVAKGLTGPLAA